ncbi:MAG TPA: carboxylesterase family protein [Steroidobacteraceae bacterium]|jgi:para-nitrobenzyl esterase
MWKWALWVTGALLLGIAALVLYQWGRGGHYPSYRASSFAALSLPVASTPATSDPVVQVDAGTLQGTHVGSIIAFRGIPYARPPVGDLRWQPPLPPVPWQGVKEATQPGSACTQRASGLAPFFAPMAEAYGSSFQQPPVQSSEDCLYLDVWVPQWPVKQALPVMVWLHGGSNTVGSGTQSTYSGTSLTQRGVLLVTLNYRLGAMGFFSHPDLTAESSHHSSGNYGLLDQLAALAWVKRNIAQFGGDPENVTLFGESAGAIDAGRLMASPLSAGLFRRVISESGPAFEPARSLSEAEAFGRQVSALAPADSQATDLQRLRRLPASEVEDLVAKAREHSAFDLTAATTDGWVLTQSPQQAFLNGSIQKVSLLIGINGRELSAFRLSAAAAAKTSGNQNSPAETGALKKFSAAAHPYFGIWTDAAIVRYFGKILVSKTAALDQAANDLIGACPVGAMANLAYASGQRVFVYRFEREIPGKGEAELGAFHSLEVPYVFGSLSDREWQWLPSTAEDAALSNLIQTYWTNFAKSGDPNAPGLPNWPGWSDAATEFLVINKDASVSAQRNFPPIFSHVGVKDLRKSFSAPR